MDFSFSSFANTKGENKTSNRTITALLCVVGGLIALNAFMETYSAQYITALLKALLLLVTVFTYGFSTLVLLRKKHTDPTEAAPAPAQAGTLPIPPWIPVGEAVAAGLIFTTAYFFALCFLKLLVPIFIWLYFLGAAALLALMAVRTKPLLIESTAAFLKRPAKEYVVFLFPLVYASIPSSFYDTLVYHLGIPNLYLLEQGFTATPQMVYANTGIFYEIALIPAVFAGDAVPRLFHFLIGTVFIFALLDFAAGYFDFDRQKIYYLLLLIISMPLTVFLLVTVKNDLLSAFFIFMGIKKYLQNNPWSSALYWGFAVGVKYFNALALVLFLPAVLLTQRKINFKHILVFALVVSAVVLPLLIKNHIYADNPFAPFLSDVFPGESFDESRYRILKADVGRIVRSLKDMVKLPYTLSFGEYGSGGIVGVQFLLFLPFLLLVKRKKNLLLFFSLLFIFAGVNFTGSVRFMAVSFFFLAFYVVLVYRDSGITFVKFLFFLIIVLNLLTSFALHQKLYPVHRLYAGEMTREQYKAMVVPTYEAFRYLEKNSPEDARVLLIGEARNFYLKRPYRVSSALDYSIIREYLSSGATVDNLITQMQSDNISFIIFNYNEFNRLDKNYKRLTADEKAVFFTFVRALEPVFKKGGIHVFDISKL
ncbi:MAG: hypothetical protein GY765_02400 [bacterium]|nr:hypothetical protein [bacterium]